MRQRNGGDPTRRRRIPTPAVHDDQNEDDENDDAGAGAGALAASIRASR